MGTLIEFRRPAPPPDADWRHRPETGPADWGRVYAACERGAVFSNYRPAYEYAHGDPEAIAYIEQWKAERLAELLAAQQRGVPDGAA